MKLKFILVLVMVFCSLFFFLSASADVDELFHKVRKGETLYRIAQMYGDFVGEIRQRNSLLSEEIFPGQILKIFPQPRMVLASWYGEKFHGRQMANGKIFNMNDPTVVAHKTLPFGTKILVWHPKNDKIIFVKVQDRGPFIRGRELDLSRQAARMLGMEKEGVARLVYLVGKF